MMRDCFEGDSDDCGCDDNTGKVNLNIGLVCSMSVHCIIRSDKHQLMHQNIYHLYS
jgi:hypothetical protein